MTLAILVSHPSGTLNSTLKRHLVRVPATNRPGSRARVGPCGFLEGGGGGFLVVLARCCKMVKDSGIHALQVWLRSCWFAGSQS